MELRAVVHGQIAKVRLHHTFFECPAVADLATRQCEFQECNMSLYMCSIFTLIVEGF